MADASGTRTRPIVFSRPEIAVGAIAIGALAAGLGVTSAQAAPAYPSWDEVEEAKQDEASKQSEIVNLQGLLDGLETTAAEAGRQQQIAAERYATAKAALEEAIATEEELAAQAADAGEKAKVSRMRAGLLASHLARSTGPALGLNLSFTSDEADNLLYQLGTIGKLSEQSQEIYDTAVADEKAASALGEQAALAATERTRLADEASAALENAEQTAEAARNALAEQQSKQTDLLDQLASLKDTTAELEAEYQSGLTAQKAAAAAAAAANAAAARAAASASAPPRSASGTPAAPPSSPPSGNSSSGSSSGGTSGGGAPPASNPPASSPPASAPPVGAPSGSAVSTAIGFARGQIGDPYVFGGAGPSGWDCSGLTMQAYAAAGIYIGGHSSNAQYNYARNHNQLVPYSDRQAGDLIFWADGGDVYHVAIYTGGGMMIEAPYEGLNVRERGMWGSGDVVGYVARPSA